MNLKVRVKNPVFWVQIVLSILTPVLAYAGLTAQDLTTWSKVEALLLLSTALRLLKRKLLSHLVTEGALTILEIL